MENDAFQTSFEHVMAELQRLDLLIQLQVRRAQEAENRHGDGDDSPALVRPFGEPRWATVALADDYISSVQATLDHLESEIQRRSENSIAQGLTLRLLSLVERFGLSIFDVDALLICLAPELDLSYGDLYAYLRNNNNHQHATVGLILDLLIANLADRFALQSRFAAEAPLRRHDILHFVPVAGYPSAPLLAQAIKLDERIRRFLLDDDTIDEKLRSFAEIDRDEVAWESLLLDEPLKVRLKRLGLEAAPRFYFEGPAGCGKQSSARAVASSRQQKLLRLNCKPLCELNVEQQSLIIDRFIREAILQQATICLTNYHLLFPDKQVRLRTLLEERLALLSTAIIYTGQQKWQPLETKTPALYQVTFDPPNSVTRQALWERALPDIPPTLMKTVAQQFRMTGGQIQEAAAAAQTAVRWQQSANGALQPKEMSAHALYAACRQQISQKSDALLEKITPHFHWDDLILPDAQMAQLKQLVEQVKHQTQVYETWGFGKKVRYGRGVSALFAGEPGTGKTMAADILASELQRDLYKIDLSAVVSKYIGESEKNLARVFDAAEASHAVLFFDEADALFGTRTEVKDAHDRYANLEVSYLLQRMEQYDGVVILATNLRENLDNAFVRRLSAIISFPLPDEEQRLAIWENIWPSHNLLEEKIDLPFIARELAISGGYIRNIALSAAFLAAAGSGANENRPITLSHLRHAIADEYQKIGRMPPTPALMPEPQK